MIYLTLFFEFLKIGLFTFGGGYAMIPLLKETIEQHNWMSEETFYSFIGVCESTPGPIAVNMATYVGSVQGGILGSICATIGVVLPSFIIIVLIAAVFAKLLQNKIVNAFLKGIRPVIIALILEAGIIMLIKNFGFVDIETFSFDYISLIITILILVIYFVYCFAFKKSLGTIPLIICSAALGIIVNVLFNL